MNDAEGLVELKRTPPAGFLALVKRCGGRALRQQTGRIPGPPRRFYVEEFALVLIERCTPPLKRTALEVAVVLCVANPEFREGLLTVARLAPEEERRAPGGPPTPKNAVAIFVEAAIHAALAAHRSAQAAKPGSGSQESVTDAGEAPGDPQLEDAATGHRRGL